MSSIQVLAIFTSSQLQCTTVGTRITPLKVNGFSKNSYLCQETNIDDSLRTIFSMLELVTQYVHTLKQPVRFEQLFLSTNVKINHRLR